MTNMSPKYNGKGKKGKSKGSRNKKSQIPTPTNNTNNTTTHTIAHTTNNVVNNNVVNKTQKGKGKMGSSSSNVVNSTTSTNANNGNTNTTRNTSNVNSKVKESSSVAQGSSMASHVALNNSDVVKLIQCASRKRPPQHPPPPPPTQEQELQQEKLIVQKSSPVVENKEVVDIINTSDKKLDTSLLKLDQVTPSSSSSSGSSYLSNLHESYDFYHDYETCEKITDEVKDELIVYKSFDEDSDDDFVFYGNPGDNNTTKCLVPIEKCKAHVNNKNGDDVDKISPQGTSSNGERQQNVKILNVVDDGGCAKGLEKEKQVEKNKKGVNNNSTSQDIVLNATSSCSSRLSDLSQQKHGQINCNILQESSVKKSFEELVPRTADDEKNEATKHTEWKNNQDNKKINNQAIIVSIEDGNKSLSKTGARDNQKIKEIKNLAEKEILINNSSNSSSNVKNCENLSMSSNEYKGKFNRVVLVNEKPTPTPKPRKNVTTVEISGDVGIVNSTIYNFNSNSISTSINATKSIQNNSAISSGLTPLARSSYVTTTLRNSSDEDDNIIDDEISATINRPSAPTNFHHGNNSDTGSSSGRGSCEDGIYLQDENVTDKIVDKNADKKVDKVTSGSSSSSIASDLDDVTKSNETLTDNDNEVAALNVNMQGKTFNQLNARQSPEGQEQESEKDKENEKMESDSDIKETSEKSDNKQRLPPSRSSPDGADAENEHLVQQQISPIPKISSPSSQKNDSNDARPSPIQMQPVPLNTFDVTSDEDSWVEEILFEDEEMKKCQPPPLDLTLHTIVEESCEEDVSEAEAHSGNFDNNPSTSNSARATALSKNDNELEKYFNFGISEQEEKGKEFANEDSEFSDTFSESSFSIEDELEKKEDVEMDPEQLASSRLEKYFFNLGLPDGVLGPISRSNAIQHQDSDSVGSESESDNSILEKRKKIKKHHKRSTASDFDDDDQEEEDELAFGNDGFDTIKKIKERKAKSKSNDSLDSPSITNEVSQKSQQQVSNFPFSEAHLSKLLGTETEEMTTKEIHENSKSETKVNRSNSFTWSSDEEVNIMMSKLRQLIKSLVKTKLEQRSSSSPAPSNSSVKDKQLVYLENELIRLMKTSDNLKNIVEYFSSEESDVDDVYKFIKVVNQTPEGSRNRFPNFDDDDELFQNFQATIQLQQVESGKASPRSSPALLAKVMHHIGNRLAVWMKDEAEEVDNNDDAATLKCAPSVSSVDEDRFSWKGSFESALAAKRQSVGSTDSISSSDFCQGQDRSILRSSSLHHLATSQPTIEENKEEEEPASSLPRMTNLCNSLPRLNQPTNLAISRAHSLVMPGVPTSTQSTHESSSSHSGQLGPIKSARYRPPGFQPAGKSKRIDNEPIDKTTSQSTPVLTQDPANLKTRSDSLGSIFHDPASKPQIRGQVEFGLQYNYKTACLEVRVKSCRDLAAVDSKRHRSDPYVKAYLLPDKSKNGKRKTKTKKNTLNPIFEETLKFPLTLSDMQNRSLWLSVWHSDIFGKNEFLGEVLVNLKDRVFDDPNTTWWELEEMSGQMEEMPRGDVVIALKWQPKTENTGNLNVLVKEAKNLLPAKNGSPSTFIKCTMLGDKSRKQKTSICRRSLNPVFNQTLSFEDVDDEGIELSLWSYDLLSNHDLLGIIRLDYDSSLWESMISRHSFWVEGCLALS